MGSDSTEDIEAYILSSTYRSNILERLATAGRATPKGIADDTGDPRPHVSRALSELRDVGAVELAVSETRTVGRYYELTDIGEAAWQNIRSEIRSIQWTIEAPTDPTLQSVVELATEEFGTALRTVGTYDKSEFRILYARPDVLADHPNGRFGQVLRTLIFDRSLDDIDMPDNECKSETVHLGDLLVLRVHVRSDLQLSISFEESQNVSIPEFTERAVSLLKTTD